MTKQESLVIFTDLAENLETIANAIDEPVDRNYHAPSLRHYADRIRRRAARFAETQTDDAFDSLALLLEPVDGCVSRVCNDERLICNDYRAALTAITSALGDLNFLTTFPGVDL